jgi:hypothetical protein
MLQVGALYVNEAMLSGQGIACHDGRVLAIVASTLFTTI